MGSESKPGPCRRLGRSLFSQIDLLAESDVAEDGAGLLALGRGYALRLPQGPRAPGDLYHRGSLSKRVNLRDKAERRLLAVYVLEEPAIETTLGAALATAPEVAAPSPVSVLPYAQAHGWEASRYAGVFPLLLVLVSQWRWLARLMVMFGDG